MDVNRRAFLSTLLAGSAGLVLDPERLLWVPGQKTIFLPSPIAPVDWSAWTTIAIAYDGIGRPEVYVNGSSRLLPADREQALGWFSQVSGEPSWARIVRVGTDLPGFYFDS
jgi:hypothetical protein